MKINVNNLDLDKLEEETIPKEKIVRRKSEDDTKKKKSIQKNDTYKKGEE